VNPRLLYSRPVLARLCAWSTSEDIEILAYLIRHRAGQVTQRCRSLLDEVAEVLATAVENRPSRLNFGVIVEFPVGLARRVLAAATEGRGDAVRVVGSLRVSTDRQAEKGFGLDVQDRTVGQWARGHGIRLVGSFPSWENSQDHERSSPG
jgi:hypothetical protein